MPSSWMAMCINDVISKPRSSRSRRRLGYQVRTAAGGSASLRLSAQKRTYHHITQTRKQDRHSGPSIC
eukprot:scaffold123458_cov45-Attheya_sp.AAC.3